MKDMILMKVDRARELLAECKDASQAKKIADMAHAAEIYAKRQRASEETIQYAHAIKIDAMTMLGEFLRRTARATGGDRGGRKARLGTTRKAVPNLPATLTESGISFKESALAQKLAVLAEKEPEKHAAIRAATTPLASVFSSAHVSHNSGENEWYTPSEYIAAAVETMGGIDVDPASTAAANEVVRAAQFFTKEQDGTKQEWVGRVWLNPPYAGEWIGRFADKLLEELAAARTMTAIVLVNNATETVWFQAMMEQAQAICFPARRVKFWSPDKVSAPLQGQAILYFGRCKAEFAKQFKVFGRCCYVV